MNIMNHIHGWAARPAARGCRAVLCAMLLVSVASLAKGQEIRIKAEATVEPRQDVRLGDIASVVPISTDSNEAQNSNGLANLVIVSAIERPMNLTADAILMAVISQRGLASAGAGLQISGAAECNVKLAARAAGEELGVPSPAAANPESSVPSRAATTKGAEQHNSTAEKTPIAKSSEAGPTLADVIKGMILKEAAVPEEELSISFNSISPQLDRPALAGQRWLCRPLTRTFIGTVQFEAQLVQNTSILERVSVQTKVERWQTVVVLTSHISRGDIIAPENLRVERQLMDRKMNTLFASDKDIVGLESQRDLEIGSVLDQRDFRPALLAHKNEPITVVYMAGALQVQMRGRAMEDAKLHEPVQVRNEATGERYDAVVIGKDVAVAGGTLTPEQEKKIKEGL